MDSPTLTTPGSERHFLPDPDTVIIPCVKGLAWPVLAALAGLGLLAGCFLAPRVFGFYSLLCGIGLPLGAFYSVINRADAVFSRTNGTLELRPVTPMFRKSKLKVFPFSAIREFLLEPEFTLFMTEGEAFPWHLSVVIEDGGIYTLTGHFDRSPVFLAAQDAARITGKTIRERTDPTASSRLKHWATKFMC